MKHFESYYIYQNGVLNKNAFDLADEAWETFLSFFDYDEGYIRENENLIHVNTGFDDMNEMLIEELKKTAWYAKHIVLEKIGGNFYFDTDKDRKEKKWKVVAYEKRD